MTKRQFRQGDVLLEEVEGIPTDAKRVRSKTGRHIIQQGEATGHHHSIAATEADVFTIGTGDQVDRYLRIRSVATLTHQEHETVVLPAGTYRQVRQREYRPQELPAWVAD